MNDLDDDEPFWRRKTLRQMSQEEWESLCDGCGQCCRIKLEDADSGEVATTQFACALLDTHTCRCTDYPNRKRRVPGCLRLTPGKVLEMTWLPETCAYRLVAQGRDLEPWHPLVSGDPESVHAAGISVRDKVRPETEMAELADLLAEVYDIEIET